MLFEVIKKLNKIKKKHGDIPLVYMYENLKEMTLVSLTEIAVAYTDIDLTGKDIISPSLIKEDNFISEKEYDPDIHKGFSPVVFISEKL